MKNKKWKLTIFVLIILIGVAVGFFLKAWSDSVLWMGWFGALSAAAGIFTGGNYLEKKEYLKNGVDRSPKN